MLALLQAELTKLRTTRTAVGFMIVFALLGLLPSIIVLGFVDKSSNADASDFLTGAESSILLIFGIVSATSAYRHKTAITERLIDPIPARTFASRLLVYGLFGAAISAILIGLQSLIILICGYNLGDSTEWWNNFGTRTAMALLGASMGVAIGTLIRSQVGAVIITLVYLFIVNPALSALADNRIVLTPEIFSFTPFGAWIEAVNVSGDTVHSAGIAALIVAGYTIAFSLIALALENRRPLA